MEEGRDVNLFLLFFCFLKIYLAILPKILKIYLAIFSKILKISVDWRRGLQWRLLQLLECPAQLVWTGGALSTTADAVQAGDDVVDALTSYQLADALQVAIAAPQEEYLLDDVVFVGCDVNELRARAVRLVLYMFCLHIK